MWSSLAQKINFTLFSKSDYLNLIQYQKHALKIYSEKTRKNDEFSLLNMSLEPYKLA